MPGSRLRVVLLESVYEQWDSPLVRQVFVEMMNLKLKGYAVEYPHGVLALDSSDFIGSHHLVCREEGRNLVPLMGYKSVTARRCEVHRLLFPALSLMRAARAPAHETLIEQRLKECHESNLDISYDSAWTILPQARKDKALTDELRGIMKAIHVLYHEEYRVPRIIAGGVLRFKVDQLYHYWGYQPFALDGSILPPIQNPSLFGESVQFFELNRFSRKAHDDAQEYASIWKERVVLDKNDGRLKAAA